jgi:FixJ family two-component response regulator
MAHAGGQPLIAIVDDDDLFRRSMERLLKSSGFDVATFDSAEDFFFRCDLDGTACAVLDMKLPGMTGFDLQRRLITRRRPLPVVFVSAHEDAVMKVNALRAGAVAFLWKPFEEDDLLDAIHRALA